MLSVQRILARIVFILLLLFAQQAALTHAAWHASQATHAPAHEDGKASFQGGLCDLHHAFGQVLGGVQAAAAPCMPRTAVDDIAPAYADAGCIQPFLAPLSRGPPFLL